MSSGLMFGLSARNSTGKQYLYFDGDDEGFWMTLIGEYETKPIQIDFDTMSRESVEDLIKLLQARLPELPKEQQ